MSGIRGITAVGARTKLLCRSKHLTTEPSLQNSLLLFELGCQGPSVSTVQMLGLQAAASERGWGEMESHAVLVFIFPMAETVGHFQIITDYLYFFF